jgi:hypothetical protein
MSFKLSEYQQKIIDSFNDTNENLYVRDLAGSGKTFMLLELSKLINDYSVFLAFNKSIQTEIESKITNPKMKTYTFNGLGYLIMLKNSEGRKIEIKNFKTYSIVHNILDKIFKKKYVGFEEQIKIKDDVVKLYDLIKSRFCNIESQNEVDYIINFYDLFSEMYLPFELMDIIKEIDIENMRQFDEDGIINFGDQLYVTLKKLRSKEWKVPPYLLFQNLCVDECLTGDTYIKTIDGQKRIRLIYDDFIKNKTLPMVKSFNHETQCFEYKQVLNAQKHTKRNVYRIKTEGLNVIEATENHRFYTQRGYVRVDELIIGKDMLILDNVENDVTIFLSISTRLSSTFSIGSFVFNLAISSNINFKSSSLSFPKEDIKEAIFLLF